MLQTAVLLPRCSWIELKCKSSSPGLKLEFPSAYETSSLVRDHRRFSITSTERNAQKTKEAENWKSKRISCNISHKRAVGTKSTNCKLFHGIMCWWVQDFFSPTCISWNKEPPRKAMNINCLTLIEIYFQNISSNVCQNILFRAWKIFWRNFL